MARKFAELNADCRQPGEIIKIFWEDLVKEYIEIKKIQLANTSINEIEHTLNLFKKICRPFASDQITQTTINKFLKIRQDPTEYNSTNKDTPLSAVSANTINKDIRNLRAFFRYCKEHLYVKSDLKIPKIKAEEKIIRILTDDEVRELIIACGNDKQWRMRILLAVCTGLRRGDLDRLQLQHIDLNRKTISIVNKKTGKATNYQPLPDAIIPEITKFFDSEITTGQTKFFKTNFTKKWYEIKKRAGLADIEFHDLRRTFGSMQASKGVSIKTLQDMYKHSSVETTMTHYITTNDNEKREAVNKLNIEQWLNKDTK